ncbi:MAG: T9SS type A sorting domain-containing protein [Bacteroidetes bacterium]|nr:T9SS type A sorting domain-containing protein [Bacteroidota bacterium]
MKGLLRIFLFLMLFRTFAYGQIPNGSFDDWSNANGYPNPSNWGNLNAITASNGIYVCEEGIPGFAGISYLRLTTKAMAGRGIVPGVAVSGEIDTLTYLPKSGFPFSGRPQYLGYYLQYMPYDGSDSCSVSVLLSKWNPIQSQRDTVAYGASYFNSMAHEWFNNLTTLYYYSSAIPDSAIITISASASVPQNGSYIMIDDLRFDGFVIPSDNGQMGGNDLLVFPNPSSSIVNIQFANNEKLPDEILVYDLSGKLIVHEVVVADNYLLDVSKWGKGLYFLQLRGNSKTITRKIFRN